MILRGVLSLFRSGSTLHLLSLGAIMCPNAEHVSSLVRIDVNRFVVTKHPLLLNFDNFNLSWRFTTHYKVRCEVLKLGSERH